MASDKTRTSDDIRHGYKAPVMQQGRVILDRDFNALQETLSRAVEADALDIIGPCGTPDDGFAISIDASSPPAQGLWVPPAPLDTPEPHPFDFLISPGTMYVGGQRAVFAGADPGQQPFTYSYFDQPDWIHPIDPAAGPPFADPQAELIYLRLFEQEVSAVEDPDLKDVALGGADTTQRLRLMRRVERTPSTAGNCPSSLDEAKDAWLKRGLQFDPSTMRLLPRAALQVGFAQAAAGSDPCDPVATGGYLGAENQLIRVQISDAGLLGGQAKLLWGYDNASFIYRVAISPDGKTLQLNQSPVDAFHSPKSGQVVEVLRTAAVLASDPDATDPFHAQQIVRCIAEASGEVRTLTAGYDPASGKVVVDQPLPAEYLHDITPVFVRVWQAELRFDPSGGTTELADASGVTTGVQVTIAAPKNAPLPVGAYWMLAVRPGTPQAVYPERLLSSPQPPDGPRQWACPLAIIAWTGAATDSPPGFSKVVNCRSRFVNLVARTEDEEVVSQVFSLDSDGKEVVLNDGDTILGSDLARGLRVQLTKDVVDASVSDGAAFLTLELPLNIADQVVGYQPIIMAAHVGLDSDAGHINWTPVLRTQRFLAGQISLDGTATFQKDWNVSTANWRYATGRAVNAIPPVAGTSDPLLALALSNLTIGEGATSLSLSVFPAIQGTAGPVGIIFNAVDSSDYWLFGFSTVSEAGGGFVFSESNLSLNHFKNGKAVPQDSSRRQVSSFISATQVDFKIRQLPNQPLSFSAAISGQFGAPLQGDLVPTSAPPRLEKGSRTGLLSKVTGTTSFANLRIGYQGAESQALLPPRLLSRLTIKRDALRIADAQSRSTPPRPDFSRWFRVVPTQAVYGYGYYGGGGIGTGLL